MSRSHGLSGDPIHRVWLGIRARCLNPNHPAYPSYGGRGIGFYRDEGEYIVCPRLAVGPKPSPEMEIDRIDNDRGYEPGNVRWATRSENDRNRRSTTWVEFRGERRRVVDLCEEFRIPGDTARYRLRAMGMSPEEAFTTPVKPKAPNGSVPYHEPRWKCARLTDAQKREMHASYRAGAVSHSQLAARFGCSHSMVGFVVNDTRWSGT